MTTAISLYRTTIGKKVIMAVSGLVLVGFVVAHMVGNLKIFLGAESLQHYADFLREVGDPLFPRETLLWIARIVLLASVGAHITAAVQLTRLDKASRPQRYAVKKITRSYASRTLRWGGVILVLFIVYHILHFTLGQVGYTATRPYSGEEQVFNNVIYGFQNPLVAGFYITAMLALGMHLYHGVWSMLQTLGLSTNRRERFLRGVALVIAAAVVVGNISIPVAVLSGILKPIL